MSLHLLERWRRSATLRPGNIHIAYFPVIQSRLRALDKPLILIVFVDRLLRSPREVM